MRTNMSRMSELHYTIQSNLETGMPTDSVIDIVVNEYDLPWAEAEQFVSEVRIALDEFNTK